MPNSLRSRAYPRAHRSGRRLARSATPPGESVRSGARQCHRALLLLKGATSQRTQGCCASPADSVSPGWPCHSSLLSQLPELAHVHEMLELDVCLLYTSDAADERSSVD